MSTIHTYSLTGSWTGNRLSVGHLDSESLSTEVSVPQNLGGPGVGTSPEELLLGAAASCYIITLGALLSNRNIPYQRIDLESEAFVEDDHGLRFDRIEHRPTIVVEEPADEERILSLAEHAEHACMVSSAIRGNVMVTVKPRTLVQTASK